MELTFQLASDFVIVRIQGCNVLFSDSSTNFQQFVPIEFLKLNQEGIIKEFPDLKAKPFNEAKQETVKRFKEHIISLGGEERVKEYVVNELVKEGYVLKTIKQDGFRIKNV